MERHFIEISDLNTKDLEVFNEMKEVQLIHYFEPEPGIFIAESPKVIERAIDSGLAALLLVFLYFEYLVDCIWGFAVGMPVTAVLIFVYRAFFKGKIKPFFKYLREKYGLKNL